MDTLMTLSKSICEEVHGEHGMAGAPAECPGANCRWCTSLRESIDAQTCKGCGAIDSMGGSSLALGLCPTCARAQRIPCAMCLEPWQGNYTIHRDGMGVGPELPLCDGCGSERGPTCEEIWHAFRVCSQLIPEYDQGAIERARFIAHLEHASRIVKRWPSWKRDVLG